MFLKTIEAKIVHGDVTGLFTSRSPALVTVNKPQLRPVFPESSLQAATVIFSSPALRGKQMEEAARTFKTGEDVFVRLEGEQRPVIAFRPINDKELVVILEQNE